MFILLNYYKILVFIQTFRPQDLQQCSFEYDFDQNYLYPPCIHQYIYIWRLSATFKLIYLDFDLLFSICQNFDDLITFSFSAFWSPWKDCKVSLCYTCKYINGTSFFFFKLYSLLMVYPFKARFHDQSFRQKLGQSFWWKISSKKTFDWSNLIKFVKVFRKIRWVSIPSKSVKVFDKVFDAGKHVQRSLSN